MIIDTLQNAHKYFAVHPLFEQAFNHISALNLQQLEPGKYDIDGDKLRAIVSLKKGMTAEESVSKFECHDQYIDIQLCVEGIEKIGWKPREKCKNEKGTYNIEKDVQLYDELPDMYFQLTDGQFAIFFPEDVHAPMIGDDAIKKLVIKVKK